VTDPRLARYADLVCDHSLRLQAGQKVLLTSPPVASPLALAIGRAAWARGAEVGLWMSPSDAERIIRDGTEAQLAYLDPIELRARDEADALVDVWAETNTRSRSELDPEREAVRRRARRPIIERFLERTAEGMPWVGCAYPTAAEAQEAGMGTLAWERFVYTACLLEEPDPVAAWRAVGERHARLIERLATAREIRARAPGTDLTLSVEGRQWESAAGRTNLPDGEVYCCPDPASAQGEVTYTIRSLYLGRRYENVRLRFRDGVVVDAGADVGAEPLQAVLDTDEGARRLGEFAIATNHRITQATGNTGFDEKIGGTFHTALGAAFPELGGENRSAVHWDLICDLRQGGSIEADGVPVVEGGRLLV
jgi:aminopeptidase